MDPLSTEPRPDLSFQGTRGRCPTPVDTIPVLLPKLPAWSAVSRYGIAIDISRWYSNFGPLVNELERRLCRHFKTAPGAVLTVANATLGITMALMELARPGTQCLMPSWTFVATAHAAKLAGMEPVFADVHPDCGAITPAIAEGMLTKHPQIGAVVVVSPFGQPVPIAEWQIFQRQHGIPVIVDAAAGFDTVVASDLLAVVSLHATKPIGCGEGGFLLCHDHELIARLLRRENFGFHGSRMAQVPSLNAKMSEYHAAVALAALDEWPAVRKELFAVAALYRHALSTRTWAVAPRGWGSGWISSTLTVRVDPIIDFTCFEATIAAHGVDTRRWWGEGCHAHPAFAQAPRAPLPETERLARTSIGLPFHRDLTIDQVDRVVTALEAARSADRE